MGFREYIEDNIYENIDFIDDNDLNEAMVDDAGKRGKKFEKIMIEALKIAKLDLDENRYAGATWDLKAIGNSWDNYFSNRTINIKTARTKWMFASSELYKMLPWDGFDGKFDENKAAQKVKNFLKSKDIHKVIYMKPSTQEVQDKIRNITDSISILNMEEKEKEARGLFKQKEFIGEDIKEFNVRVLTRENKVSSVAIDFGGKVFMRSEKPRKIGGSIMVAFRTPTRKLGAGTMRKIAK